MSCARDKPASKGNDNEGTYVSLFKWPEIRFAVEWELGDPREYVQERVVEGKDSPKDDSAPQGDEQRPLAHRFGFTIPRAQYGVTLPRPPTAAERLRDEFPALSRFHPAVFGDNASATQVPGAVVQAVQHVLVESSVQASAEYGLSRGVARTLQRARDFEHVFTNSQRTGEIVLGDNATALLHRIAHALEASWDTGGEVVLSEAAHESVRGVWEHLASRGRGVVVKEWRVGQRSVFPLEGLRQAVSANTRVVALSHVCAVTGEVLHVEEAVRVVRRVAPNAVVVVEGSNFAAHRCVDVRAWGVDVYAYSTHKVFGPQLGVMFVGRSVLKGIAGPNHPHVRNNDHPRKLELGSVNVASCVGRLALQDYVLRACELLEVEVGAEAKKDAGALKIGHGELRAMWAALRPFEDALRGQLLDFLNQEEGVVVYGGGQASALAGEGGEGGEGGEEEADHVPIVSFTHKRVSNSAILDALLQNQVQASVGHQNCPVLCAALGVDNGEGRGAGVVRVSLVHYNVPKEVAVVTDTLRALFHPDQGEE